MKALIAVILCIPLICTCKSRVKKSRATLQSAGVPAGNYLELSDMELKLKTRIFEETFRFIHYASAIDSFLVGKPNSVGNLAWLSFFSKLTDLLSSTCRSGQSSSGVIEFSSYGSTPAIFRLNFQIRNSITYLCNLGVDLSSAPSDQLANLRKPPYEALDGTWDAVMKLDAPPSEKEAWIAEMARTLPDQESGVKIDHKAYIKAVYLSLFMNPYFLLEQ